MLLFCIGNNRYALDTKSVVEIIPKIKLKPVYGAHPAIVGLLNYQGSIIPVLSLNQLLGEHDCSVTLSTRIILINQKRPDKTQQVLGLLAEQVTETLDSSQVTHVADNVQVSHKSGFGKILLQQQAMIQCLEVDQLLSEQDYATIFPNE